MTKINILAITAHPDDAELSCSGTLIAHRKKGYTIGAIDLTRGELGTRGTIEIRKQEAAEAAAIMGLSVRENMGFADGFFSNDREHQMALISKIRTYQPDIVITNALFDRHSDHGRAAALVTDACFLSGLAKIETQSDGTVQQAWRPDKVYYVIQSSAIQPDILVDISEEMDQKIESVKAYKSQFYDPNVTEAPTYISSPEFLEMIHSRAREYGHRIGVKYAEGFQVRHALGVSNLFHLS